MRIDTRFLNWGVFFIIAGVIPLAVEQGVLSADTAADWWRLWPLLLIGAGVGLLLRRTPGRFLGGLIVAAFFGVMVGGAITAGSRLDFGTITCGSSKGTTSFSSQSGTFDASGVDVALELGCGELTVDTAAGTRWTVAGTSSDGRRPDISASGGALEVRSRDRGVSVPPFTESLDVWSITLPWDARMSVSTTVNAGSATLNLAGAALDSLSTTVNAGSARLDLSGTTPSRLSMTVNAGSGTITFPDASLSGSMTVNAGSIRFCVPPSVGLQLTTSDNVTGGNNYASRGLTKTGSTWQSANLATATNRLILSTTANLGGLELNPDGGCT